MADMGLGCVRTRRGGVRRAGALPAGTAEPPCRTDALLVPCKAAGLGWVTVRAILKLRGGHNTIAGHDMDVAMEEFGKLSQPTAARVLRFWQVRQTTTIQAAE